MEYEWFFSYNNSVHSSIGYSPFFTNTGYHPRWSILKCPEVTKNPAVEDRLHLLQDVQAKLSVHLRNAQSMASDFCGLDEGIVIIDFATPRNLDMWFFGASVIARLVQSISGLWSSNHGKPRITGCLGLWIILKLITHAKWPSNIRTVSDSSTISPLLVFSWALLVLLHWLIYM